MTPEQSARSRGAPGPRQGGGGARPAAASSRSSSARRPASARPTRCWRRRASSAPTASTSSSATWRPTAAPRPRPSSKGSRSCPAGSLEYRGTTLRSSTSTPRSRAAPPSSSSTSWPTPTRPAPATPSAGRTCVELLDAGIDVYTTVNVQHVESLNDVVAKITGVVVRETVPDSVLEQADEVELIDLPPDDLLERFREGKVYMPAQAQEAARALLPQGQPDRAARAGPAPHRRAGRRADARLPARARHRPARGRRAERLLVCIGPSPWSARLVRAAKRMADQLGAEWIAAYVETPAQLRLPAEARDGVIQTLRLAEQLGAETHHPQRPDDERGDPRLRARPQRHQDRGRQARPGRAGSASSSARSWTRSCRAAATSTSTSSAASARRARRPRRRAGRAAADRLAGVRHGPAASSRSGHRRRLAAVPVLRALQPRHGLPARHRHRRHAHRPGPLPAGRRCSASPPSTSSSSRPTSPSRSRDAQYLFTFLVMLVVGLVISGLDRAHPRARPRPPSTASSGRRRSTP